MRVARNFDVSGLNIRVHSKHASTEYIEFWRMLHKSKMYVVHASNVLMIGEIRYENKEDSDASIFGNFYRFLDVNPENPWFNINQHKKATDEDVNAVNIPPELKPDLVEIPYVFDVKNHRLYFVSKESDASISPYMVNKLMGRLCDTEAVLDRFGKVDLTILTDKAQVDEMLAWPILRSLTIKIDRPNPTDYDDDAAFYAKLEKRGLSSEVRIYKKADEVNSLIPDDEMKSLAHIAADNGEVIVTGKNEKRWSATASSKKFPLRIKAIYDTTLQSLLEALRDVVSKVRKK